MLGPPWNECLLRTVNARRPQNVGVFSSMFPRKAMNLRPFPPRRTERAARHRGKVLQRTQSPNLATCMGLPSKHFLDYVDSWVCNDLVCCQREIIDKSDKKLMSRWHLVWPQKNTENKCASTPVWTAVPKRRKRVFSTSQAFADVLKAGLKWSGRKNKSRSLSSAFGAPTSLRVDQAGLPQVAVRWKFEAVFFPSRKSLLVTQRVSSGRPWRHLARTGRHKRWQRRAGSARPSWADPGCGLLCFFTWLEHQNINPIGTLNRKVVEHMSASTIGDASWDSARRGTLRCVQSPRHSVPHSTSIFEAHSATDQLLE